MKITVFIIVTVGLTCAGWAAVAERAPGPGDPVKAQRTASPSDNESASDDLVTQGADLERVGQREIALKYYEQAALAGNGEGAFRAGKLSWETAMADTGKAKVLKLDAGLRYTCRAATNRHAGACLSLSQAFREGLVVQADLAQAYTWLIIAKKCDPTIPTATLDEWVVKLDTATLQQAQETARHWLADGWPARIAPTIILGDARLKIHGVSRGANTTILINRKTFMVGDSASLSPLFEAKSGARTNAPSLNVTCAAIGSDYVLVKVAGEADLRLLDLDAN